MRKILFSSVLSAALFLSVHSANAADINTIPTAGIMNGVLGGNFAPNDYYSIEQAISAVNRLYDLLSK